MQSQNLDMRLAGRTDMSDSEASGLELLLSDPQIVAWLEADEDEGEEDD